MFVECMFCQAKNDPKVPCSFILTFFQDALLRKTSPMTVMISLTKLWRANRIALTTVKQFWVGIFGRGTQGTSAVG